MQGGAPRHSSKLVCNFLKKKNIKMFHWPDNIPNINPIENLLKIPKNKMADKHSTSAGNDYKTHVDPQYYS